MNPDEAKTVEAAEWLARRDRGLTALETREFARWVGGDPRRAAEFARLDAEWHRLDAAGSVPELARLAKRLGRRRTSPSRWGPACAAVAAAVAVAALFWLIYRRPAPSHPHAPPPPVKGEQVSNGR
jgi:ferric-dicitrate binding protein FerR (iron transport regulator)